MQSGIDTRIDQPQATIVFDRDEVGGDFGNRFNMDGVRIERAAVDVDSW